MALTRTLNNIKNRLNGYPTVLWSGRGYHIIQPIDCPVNLDNVKEFTDLTDNPNNKFLQFAKRYLSDGKADNANNPALKSCQLRVPHSYNAKCKQAGVDAEVKILQKWDGFRPDYRLLIGSFYAHLVGVNEQKKPKSSYLVFVAGQDYGPIDWIERLLSTPIDDFRKHARDLILVPYLVIRRGITDESQVTQIVMQWADKCAELRRLEPSRREFDKRIQSRIYEVMRDRIPPMSFIRLEEENPELAKMLTMS